METPKKDVVRMSRIRRLRRPTSLVIHDFGVSGSLGVSAASRFHIDLLSNEKSKVRQAAIVLHCNPPASSDLPVVR